MSKKFLINNQKSGQFLIKHEFHKALTNEGFIEEITDLHRDVISITEEQSQQNLTITHLNTNSVCNIWRINLEMEIIGISSKSTAKTPEIAILVLQNLGATFRLSVLLIELKSTLKNSDLEKGKRKAGTLEECKAKFVGGMNRLYMLLSLLNHHNPKQGFDQATILVDFYGFIFYENNKLSDFGKQTEAEADLYHILNNPTGANLLDVESILSANDKIRVRFFQKTNKISLQKILFG